MADASPRCARDEVPPLGRMAAVVNVHPDTAFRLSVTNPEHGLPPITVAAFGSAWSVHTYWTPQQAREVASELMAMAEATDRPTNNERKEAWH